MKKHADEAEDKKLILKMIAKKSPVKKVSKHLKKDIKESHKSIAEDKKLMKGMKKGKSY